MSTTASGFFYPATGYTAGEFQELKDMADSTEAVVSGTRNFRTFSVANSAALAALSGSYTLREGLDFARRTDNKITYRYSGSAWKEWESDWITYSPVLTNFTIGTGGTATVGRYRYRAGMVLCEVTAFLGTSGASVSTGPRCTLPVTATGLKHSFMKYDGNGDLFDSSISGVWPLDVLAYNTSATTVQLNVRSGTYGQATDVSATVPFTWAAGDAFTFTIEYAPA